MTLLFIYSDRDFVMHISDERISQKIKGKWEVRDDHTTKQVLIRGTAISSFTGIATVQKMPTAEWLCQRFSESAADLDATLKTIANRLTRIFRNPGYADQFLIVVISGWFHLDDSSLGVVHGIVTNQDPQTLERQPTFNTECTVASDEANWMTYGQTLSPQVCTTLTRRIRKALRAGVSPSVLQELFLGAMRSTNQHNRWVGPSALIGTLPRQAMEYGAANPDNHWVWTNNFGHTMPGAVTFTRIPNGTVKPIPATAVIVRKAPPESATTTTKQ